MNKIFLLGRLVEDPSTRMTQSNIVRNLSVNRRKKEDGQPTADFFQITAWRKHSGICPKVFQQRPTSAN